MIVYYIKSMQSYGISVKMCSWISNFLSNRKQLVNVNGNFSKWHSVLSGIPQGSVLGPILFVCFINDLPECVESPAYLFADDTKLFREILTSSDQKTLQYDLNHLFDWSCSWLLRFHPDKCKVLKIHNKRSKTKETKYNMHPYEGSIIELDIMEEEKDIDVIIDSKFNI
jgi:hypothetical protein